MAKAILNYMFYLPISFLIMAFEEKDNTPVEAETFALTGLDGAEPAQVIKGIK